MDTVKKLWKSLTASRIHEKEPFPARSVSRVADQEAKHAARPQSLYRYIDNCWQSDDLDGETNPSIPLNLTFRLISWNIDCQAQGKSIRMAAALSYLEQLIEKSPPTMPIVLFLQEMTSIDLVLIQAAPWIQARFDLTDIDPSHWQGYYDTTTLVDRRLPVTSLYRVHYKTYMQRNGLFVDLKMASASQMGIEATVRLCNTHLESLVSDPRLRPAQVGIVAQHLHSSNIHAGLVAGDFNAIEPFDRSLHTDNNFKDAYLQLGGQEDSEEGHTWGQQVHADLRERFGCTRMDKIFYCGDMRIGSFQRIGIGVKVEESKIEKLRSFGCMEYVTDHYGLMADVYVE